jgi:hypothetical protein
MKNPIKALSFLAIAIASVVFSQSVACAQDLKSREAIPLSNSPSLSDYSIKPLTFRQQQARFAAEQMQLRMEFNKWNGYSPTRPNTNASYMYTGLYDFYPASNYTVAYSSRHRFYGW